VKPVTELDWIGDCLAVWHGFDPEVRCECGSTAVLGDEGWVIFDPIPLSTSAWAELLAVAKVHAIALTSGNHQRDSLAIKSALKTPIHAPESARGEIEADVWCKDGDTLVGFSLTGLPGAGPGEAAWCDGRHLVVGDALLHLDQLEFLPDKYCSNPAELRKSTKQLLGLNFQSVFFAHGLPLISQARENIATLLA
jgi:glyoxylase-like metal-dependent hydrolase (beta-lactamase superfamily II)